MSYIPTSLANFYVWAQNFASLVTANPTAYGETAATALVVQTAVDDFSAAYLLAADPSTRTSPVVADQAAKRSIAESRIRPMAQRINASALVTDEQRGDLGLTIRKTTRTPVAPPTVAPSLSVVSVAPGVNIIQIRSEDTPESKAKPPGVIGVEIFRSVGAVPAVDPGAAAYFGTSTKSPVTLSTHGTDPGDIVTYFARYVTRSGAGGVAYQGPFSLPLAVVAL